MKLNHVYMNWKDIRAMLTDLDDIKLLNKTNIGQILDKQLN